MTTPTRPVMSSRRTPGPAPGVSPATGRDRGSATVLALVLVGVLTVAALAVAAVGGLLVGQRRAAAAADLAALAAAAELSATAGGTTRTACDAARRLGHVNGARLTRCEAGLPSLREAAAGRDVRVEVVVDVTLLGHRWPVAGSARAGPVTGP